MPLLNGSLDILRQGTWDLWVWVCVAASAVLLTYALGARLWTGPRGWLRGGLVLGGVAGTILVLAMPGLRSPLVGMVWTFALLAILSATFYLNLEGQISTRRMGVLLGMRIAALALLVPMLFEPVIRYTSRPEPERPLLMLVDTSGSMSFPDVQNGPTRLQSVWQTLRPQVPKLYEHFVPRIFTFDSRFEALDAFDDLATRQADGQSTDIAGAVTQALATTARSDAAVILISDGIDNTSADVAGVVRGSTRPVHTVRVGSEQTEPATLANIAVDNIDAAEDLVVDHQSILTATIKSSALANRVVDVKLARVDEQGNPMGEVTTKPLVLQPLAEGQVVELPYTPKEAGVQRLVVWVDPVPGERSTVDNRQEYQGLALDPRIKVLYVEGRARPEYRELHRALGRDANIESASLLRIQQDRFTASGTIDGERLTALPASVEQWEQVDVIIMGDLDSSYLSPTQQQQIEQAVQNGAGLLMIGGQHTLGPGGYAGTPLERALPVFVGGTDAPQETTPFVPRLTDAGRVHPVMDGLANWFDADGGEALPPLLGNVVVDRPKSGAQVLLVHQDRPGPDGQPQIALAVQNYGQGRSAVFTGDTTYKWYLPLRGMGQDSPYNRFWGQLVRWLAGADVKSRQKGAGLEALLSKSLYQLGESVQVRAMVRDERGDATRYAQVTATLVAAGGGSEPGEPQQLPMVPSDGRTGMYDVTIPHPPAGDWEVRIRAVKDEVVLGEQVLRFSVIPPADEMLKLAADPQLLAEVANSTGGFHYSLAQLPALIDQLVRQDESALQSEHRTIPVHNVVRLMLAAVGQTVDWPRRYDLPMQGLLVTGLLVGEWVLRRKWQLA